MLSWSAIGFNSASGTLRSEDPFAIGPQPSTNPIETIAKYIVRNKYGLARDDLIIKANPHGQGNFVFATIPILDTKRRFLWFVGSGEAVNLNGPAREVTPELPSPVGANYSTWKGSGFASDKAFTIGSDIALGDPAPLDEKSEGGSLRGLLFLVTLCALFGMFWLAARIHNK